MQVDVTKRPRTRLIVSDEQMTRLRDLYYDRDTPMVKIAAAFGVSTSTLYHWIAEMDWPRRSATFPIRSHPGTGVFAPYAGETAPVSLTASGAREVLHDSGTRSATAEGGDGAPQNPSDTERLAKEVADAARGDLAALGPLDGPAQASLTLFERERRAKIFASLSQSIARIDRVSAAQTERRALMARIGELEREIDARMEGPFAAMQALIEQQLIGQATAQRSPPRTSASSRTKRI